MKKILCVFLSAALMLGISGCGSMSNTAKGGLLGGGGGAAIGAGIGALIGKGKGAAIGAAIGAAAGLFVGLIIWIGDAFIIEFRNVKKANEKK